MNETRSFRRIAATLTIGSFSIAALMGIVALLGGGDFGEGEARVLLTTLVVGCASICALCYLATAGTRFGLAGIAGALVLLVPTVTALMLIWTDWESGDKEGMLKTFGIGVVAAVTLAQVCLLLALAGTRAGLRLLLGATVVLAFVVAGIVSGLILGGIEADGVWRGLGVAAILDVLGTLVTIALAKFRDDDDAPARGDLRVRLTPDQAAAIDALGQNTGRTREQVVGEALEQFLAR